MRLRSLTGIVLLAIAPSAAAAAATFTVDSTGDLFDVDPGNGVCATAAGTCTLRAAIEEANLTGALDTIAFAIPGAGVHTIATGTLPVITSPIVLDGFTQPGAQPNTNPTGGLNTVLKIELTGGLSLQAADATVRGLVLSGGSLTFTGAGAPTRRVLEGCYVGTDPTGTVVRPGGGVYFLTSVAPLRVGGTSPGQRNLIAGQIMGISASCPTTAPCAPGSAIQGNLIGTDATGTVALGNRTGIYAAYAGGLVIGGTTPAERNVISGNDYGIVAFAWTYGPILVQGNLIGEGVTGAALPNMSGIRTSPHPHFGGGPTMTIGGSPAAANRIAHNTNDGLRIFGGHLAVSHNVIASNTVGVRIESFVDARFAQNDIEHSVYEGVLAFGLFGQFTGDRIRNNGGSGITLLSVGAAELTGAAIHDNGGLGIDLGGDGVTPNDPLDQDLGPNDLLNYPVLERACSGSVGSVVTGMIQTRPSSSVTIELFRSPSCDPSAHGEGGQLAGTATLLTDAGGNAAISMFAADALSGFITATATAGSPGSRYTSEFSRCVPVDAPAPAQAIAGPTSVCSGTPFALEAVAGAQAYQWFRDGVAIPGATDLRYVRPAAAAGDAGSYTVRAQTCAAFSTSPAHALAVVACSLTPVGLAVDAHAIAGTASNLNGVLEAGEAVAIEPRYRNDTPSALALSGTGTIGGPIGGSYALPDASASYGSVPAGQITDCFGATSDCYVARVTAGARPLTHWDATLAETTSGGDPARHWRLHVGETFGDVPVSNGFYRFIEALVHIGVTGGCTDWSFCPASPTTREQMAVFVLVAREGVGYRPPDCNPSTPRFADVPASSPFCRWIEELARRQVVAGCTANRYCPSVSVSREQMSVFVLATREAPGYVPPACVAGAERFADVPAPSPFCRWIEELHRRGVVAGCGNGNFCPGNPITRGEMSVFLTVTFGLLLYGP